MGVNKIWQFVLPELDLTPANVIQKGSTFYNIFYESVVKKIWLFFEQIRKTCALPWLIVSFDVGYESQLRCGISLLPIHYTQKTDFWGLLNTTQKGKDFSVSSVPLVKSVDAAMSALEPELSQGTKKFLIHSLAWDINSCVYILIFEGDQDGLG